MNPILPTTTFECRRTADARPRPRLRTLVVAACFSTALLALNSCATARGFGSDVETVGENIEDAATR